MNAPASSIAPSQHSSSVAPSRSAEAVGELLRPAGGVSGNVEDSPSCRRAAGSLRRMAGGYFISDHNGDAS
jgi:hypothetical protein